MKKKLIGLACAAIIVMGGAGVSSADNNKEEMSGIHVFREGEPETRARELVGGGIWDYSIAPVPNNGGLRKRCRSEFLQRARLHSSYAQVGSSSDRDVQKPGIWTFAEAFGRMDSQAVAKWNNLE